MGSSQALAQSIFGNLKASGQLPMLQGLRCENGQLAFGAWNPFAGDAVLEHDIHHLGEPRPTSIDVFLSGEYSVAIECKLMEDGFGACSRTRISPQDSTYAQQFCDGNYRVQRNRMKRCSLTEIGVRYWHHIPNVLDWDPESNLSPCPLRNNYQLARNVLAIAPDGNAASGHALVIYDARNPAFAGGGEGQRSLGEVTGALKDKRLLRRISWQELVAHLRRAGLTMSLAEKVLAKYGF